MLTRQFGWGAGRVVQSSAVVHILYRLPRCVALEMRSDADDVLWDNSNPVGLSYKKILRTICKFGQ